MLSNLLAYRLLIFNVLMVVLVGALGLKGYVLPLFIADVSFVTAGIAVLFALTLASTGVQAAKTVRLLNGVKQGMRPAPRKAAKRPEKIAHVRDAAGWMVGLGLVGTVIGFIVALSGVDPATAGSASGVQDMVANLIQGMGVALNTTLVGAVAGIWTEVNYRMLRTATSNLLHDVRG